MPAVATKMKWALCSTWQRVSEFRTKKEAEEALADWEAEMVLAGWLVTGSIATAKWARDPNSSVSYHEDMQRASRGEHPRGVKVAYVKRLEEVRLATH